MDAKFLASRIQSLQECHDKRPWWTAPVVTSTLELSVPDAVARVLPNIAKELGMSLTELYHAIWAHGINDIFYGKPANAEEKPDAPKTTARKFSKS